MLISTKAELIEEIERQGVRNCFREMKYASTRSYKYGVNFSMINNRIFARKRIADDFYVFTTDSRIVGKVDAAHLKHPSSFTQRFLNYQQIPLVKTPDTEDSCWALFQMSDTDYAAIEINNEASLKFLQRIFTQRNQCKKSKTGTITQGLLFLSQIDFYLLTGFSFYEWKKAIVHPEGSFIVEYKNTENCLQAIFYYETDMKKVNAIKEIEIAEHLKDSVSESLDGCTRTVNANKAETALFLPSCFRKKTDDNLNGTCMPIELKKDSTGRYCLVVNPHPQTCSCCGKDVHFNNANTISDSPVCDDCNQSITEVKKYLDKISASNANSRANYGRKNLEELLAAAELMLKGEA